MRLSIFLKAHSYAMIFSGLFSFFFAAQASAQPQLTDDISNFFFIAGINSYQRHVSKIRNRPTNVRYTKFSGG
jgi:hypothetical protein